MRVCLPVIRFWRPDFVDGWPMVPHRMIGAKSWSTGLAICGRPLDPNRWLLLM